MCRLNPQLVTTDVQAFETALMQARRAETPQRQVEEWTQVIGLYGGPLLPGFYEDWALRERERLHQAYVNALRTLVDVLHSQQEGAQALACAQRLRAAAPLEEETPLMLMRLYAATNQTSAVKRQFQEWEQIAERELGETPSPTARLLLTQLTDPNRRPTDAFLSYRKGSYIGNTAQGEASFSACNASPDLAAR